MNIINKNGLDPITVYDLGPIKAMLTREEMQVPEQEDDEDDQQYRDRLIQVWNIYCIAIIAMSYQLTFKCMRITYLILSYIECTSVI